MRPRQSHKRRNEAQTNRFARPLIVMDELYERANRVVDEMTMIGRIGRFEALAWGASEVSHAVEA